MKVFFSQTQSSTDLIEEELTAFNLQDAIEKTRLALDIAYAGFDNAVDEDIIDSYIYEINALQKRYKHLTNLAEVLPRAENKALRQHSPIRALVSHVFS